MKTIQVGHDCPYKREGQGDLREAGEGEHTGPRRRSNRKTEARPEGCGPGNAGGPEWPQLEPPLLLPLALS